MLAKFDYAIYWWHGFFISSRYLILPPLSRLRSQHLEKYFGNEESSGKLENDIHPTMQFPGLECSESVNRVFSKNSPSDVRAQNELPGIC